MRVGSLISFSSDTIKEFGIVVQQLNVAKYDGMIYDRFMVYWSEPGLTVYCPTLPRPTEISCCVEE